MFIVTGSSSGIGKSIYKSLKKTDEVLGIAKENSDIECDLSFEDNIISLVNKIISLNKDISGVITSAGVIGGGSDKVISTNYFGSTKLIELLYNHYKSINAILIGSIIFTHAKTDQELIDLLLQNKKEKAIDFANKNNLTDTVIYASCKLALISWMRNFIKNNPHSRINIIHPSLTKTGMTEKYLQSKVIQILFSDDVKKLPPVDPEEVSGIVCYLIKNSRFVNAQSIFIDNGVYSV